MIPYQLDWKTTNELSLEIRFTPIDQKRSFISRDPVLHGFDRISLKEKTSRSLTFEGKIIRSLDSVKTETPS